MTDRGGTGKSEGGTQRFDGNTDMSSEELDRVLTEEMRGMDNVSLSSETDSEDDEEEEDPSEEQDETAEDESEREQLDKAWELLRNGEGQQRIERFQLEFSELVSIASMIHTSCANTTAQETPEYTSQRDDKQAPEEEEKDTEANGHLGGDQVGLFNTEQAKDESLESEGDDGLALLREKNAQEADALVAIEAKAREISRAIESLRAEAAKDLQQGTAPQEATHNAQSNVSHEPFSQGTESTCHTLLIKEESSISPDQVEHTRKEPAGNAAQEEGHCVVQQSKQDDEDSASANSSFLESLEIEMAQRARERAETIARLEKQRADALNAARLVWAQSDAAVSIQRICRGWISRRRRKQRSAAVNRIQGAMRAIGNKIRAVRERLYLRQTREREERERRAAQTMALESAAMAAEDASARALRSLQTACLQAMHNEDMLARLVRTREKNMQAAETAAMQREDSSSAAVRFAERRRAKLECDAMLAEHNLVVRLVEEERELVRKREEQLRREEEERKRIEQEKEREIMRAAQEQRRIEEERERELTRAEKERSRLEEEKKRRAEEERREEAARSARTRVLCQGKQGSRLDISGGGHSQLAECGRYAEALEDLLRQEPLEVFVADRNSFERLADVAPSVCFHCELRELRVASNLLTSIVGIGLCQSLTHLDLSRNRLTGEALAKASAGGLGVVLPHLERLDLSGNPLGYFEAGRAPLQRLRELRLSRCELKAGPEYLVAPSLRELLVDSNNIADDFLIHQSCHLPELLSLDLRGNLISRLSRHCAHVIPVLERLDISHNCLNRATAGQPQGKPQQVVLLTDGAGTEPFIAEHINLRWMSCKPVKLSRAQVQQLCRFLRRLESVDGDALFRQRPFAREIGLLQAAIRGVNVRAQVRSALERAKFHDPDAAEYASEVDIREFERDFSDDDGEEHKAAGDVGRLVSQIPAGLSPSPLTRTLGAQECNPGSPGPRVALERLGSQRDETRPQAPERQRALQQQDDSDYRAALARLTQITQMAYAQRSSPLPSLQQPEQRRSDTSAGDSSANERPEDEDHPFETQSVPARVAVLREEDEAASHSDSFSPGWELKSTATAQLPKQPKQTQMFRKLHGQGKSKPSASIAPAKTAAPVPFANPTSPRAGKLAKSANAFPRSDRIQHVIKKSKQPPRLPAWARGPDQGDQGL